MKTFGKLEKLVGIIPILLVAVTMMCFCSSLYADNLTFKTGIFYPSLNSDLWDQNKADLTFGKTDLDAPYFAMEYELFLNRYLSLAVEGGYYKDTHHAIYRDYETIDGDGIPQSLSLETANLDVDIKFYPLGFKHRLCPFIGIGGTMNYWEYKQWGDFIIDNDLFEDQYVESSGYSPGFNAKAGFIFRFNRAVGISMETRYQYLKGNLSSDFEGFGKLDMSGFSANVGLTFTF